ncbi:MAG: PAS domain-containing protein [Bacteroidia bacterium]|nr:PAS domain-containing protein [Bacteroidia bacterium]
METPEPPDRSPWLVPYPTATDLPPDWLYAAYPDALAFLSADGTLLSGNPALATTLGLDPERLVGAHLHDYLAPSASERLAQTLLQVPPQGSGHLLAELRPRQGATPWVAWTFLRPSDEPVFFAVGRDVTEYQDAIAHLTERESQLSRSLQVSGIATWELDLATLELTLDSRMQTLLGTTGVHTLPLEAFVDLYTEGKGAHAFFLAMLRLARSTEANYHEELGLQLRTEGNTLTPVWFQLQAARGASGRVDTVFGAVLRQPTASQHAVPVAPTAAPPAHPTEAPAPELTHLLEAGHLATFRIDPEELTFEASAELKRWLGYHPTDALSWATFAQSHLGPARAVALSQALHTLSQGDFDGRELTLPLRTLGGDERTTRCVLRVAAGHTLRVLGVVQDIGAYTHAADELQAALAAAEQALEASGVLRLSWGPATVALDPNWAAALGLESNEMPHADFEAALGSAELPQALAEVARTAEPQQARIETPVLGLLDVRMWPVEGSVLAVALPAAPQVPPLPLPDPDETPAAAPYSPPAHWASVLLTPPPAESLELPDQLAYLFEGWLAHAPGVALSLWLVQPDGASSYRVYPTAGAELSGAPFEALSSAFVAHPQLGPEWATRLVLPHTSLAWSALALWRGSLWLGYLLVESTDETTLQPLAWPLLTLGAQVTVLLDRETLRETQQLAEETTQALLSLQTELKSLKTTATEAQAQRAALATAYEGTLGWVAIGQLGRQVLAELAPPVEELVAKSRTLDQSLTAVLNELPGTLRLVDEVERTLLWDLLARILTVKRTQSGDVPTLRSRLEVELNGFGVAQAGLWAQRLVAAGVTEGLAQYIPLLRHPNAELLLGRVFGLAELRQQLSRLQELADHSHQLLDTLAHVTEPTDPAHGPSQTVDLTDALEAALALFGHRFASGIRLERIYEAKPRVEVVPGQLTLLLVELLRTRLERLAAGQLLRITVRQAGALAQVLTTDNGPAIPLLEQESLALLAEPEHPEAPGFALRRTQSLSKHLGGRFEVRSAPDQTLLLLEIPLP